MSDCQINHYRLILLEALTLAPLLSCTAIILGNFREGE
jgi:hypothetical protein